MGLKGDRWLKKINYCLFDSKKSLVSPDSMGPAPAKYGGSGRPGSDTTTLVNSFDLFYSSIIHIELITYLNIY